MRYLFGAVGTAGLLGPMIAVAQVLQKRGHAVAFVTSAAMEPLLSRNQLARIPRGTVDGPSFEADVIGHPLETARQVRHIEYGVQSFRPDVLVGQPTALGPLIAGRRFSLPVAMLGPAAYLWPDGQRGWGEPPSTPFPQFGELVRVRYQEMVAAYEGTAQIYGLPPGPAGQNPLLGDLCLVQSVPELEGSPEGLPDQVHLVGGCLCEDRATNPGLDAWLQDAHRSGQPVLYLCLGRFFGAPDLWRDLVQGLADLPIRVAGSVGRTDTVIEEVPAHWLVLDHLPQGAVLPHAAAVLSGGTTTSVVGALQHGLPLLLTPGRGGEHQDLTLRCLHAGVALDLPALTASPAEIRRGALKVLESGTLRANAQRLQQAFARAGGPTRAADLLEELGRSRRPVLRATVQ